jgi:hypothetical protein
MSDTVFGNPDGPDHSEHDPGAHQRPVSSGLLTVEDVLASARLVERTASICLRADLTAEHDLVLGELGTRVTASGEVIGGDEEGAVSDQSNASRAQELADRLQQIKIEMRASMWHVRFRAMDSDTWTAFKKQHWPKAKGADMTEFRTKIIAECAIEPPITEDQVRQLRKKLNASQFVDLSDTAFAACSEGGLDVPKSPTSWVNLAQR